MSRDKVAPTESAGPWGTKISGSGGYTESWLDPVSGERQIRTLSSEPTIDGFSSAWHRERYRHDLDRALAGAEARADNVHPDLDHPARAERAHAAALEEIENVRREIARLDNVRA